MLVPGGELLLSFHVGNEIVDPKEMWGKPIEMSFCMLDPAKVQEELRSAGLSVEELIEREPYAPEIEHQMRRAYMSLRKH